MNIKENQKYQSTHQAVMDAMMEALKTKSIKQITVAELCRTVHINRSTFYEHFLDVYDVLEQIADNVSGEILNQAPQDTPTRENFLNLYRYIKDNKELYTLFFHQNLPLYIYEKFFPSEEPPFPPHAILHARGIKNDVQLEYHYAFFRAGLDAILKKWLERDCAETPEEIYDLLKAEYKPDGEKL